MNAEKCIVFNDPTSECPMLIINTNPVMIRLAQSSTSYWAQTVYQLSHEICHYAIRQGKANKDYTLSWLEETICEAMSLYMLQYSAEKWCKCPLSQRAPQFSKSITAYLVNELKRNALYQVISKFSEESYCFCDMYQYLNEDKLTVDFEQWLAVNPSEIVQCLSQIQPKL